MTATLHVPDTSEFQASVDFNTLHAHGYDVVILRAHNGYRADHAIAGRIHQARAVEQVRLFYGYCVNDRDPVQQAHELAAIVGPLQPGEAFVCDYEATTGNGTDAARATAYLNALAGRDVLYSGDHFYHDHLSGVHTKGLLLWDAAYQSAEPSTPHFLWQHTDKQTFPGISGACDCSIFHGTATDLRNLISPPAPKPAAKPATKPAAKYAYKRTLKVGMSGEDVKHLQGILHLTQDGKFGPKTEAAVKAAQKTHHLAEDGVFGPKSQAAFG